MAKYDLFILDGDSNSCYGTTDGTNGDATIGAAGSRIFCWTASNTIVVGNDPLNFAGVGTSGNKNSIGVSFAKRWRDLGYLRSDRNILLIAAAHAGTGFTSGHWQPGGSAHEATVSLVNAAMASGHDIVIQAMVFNGGANDAGVNTPNFDTLFVAKIADYRARITGFAHAPIVMGNFVPEWKDQSGTRLTIWNNIVNMPNLIDNLVYSPPDIPTYLTAHNPPTGIHFSSSAMEAYSHRQVDDLIRATRKISVSASIGSGATDFVLSWNGVSSDNTPTFYATGWPVLADIGDTLRLTVDSTNYDVVITPYEKADGAVDFATGRFLNGSYVVSSRLITSNATYVSNILNVTINDNVAPTVSNVTGTAALFNPTTGTGSYTTDEDNGTVYWVVTTSATRPSNAQITAGQTHTGSAAPDSGSAAITAAGTFSIVGGFTGLTASTTYYVHVLHVDFSGNASTGASSSSFTTIDPLTGAETIAGSEPNGVFVDFRDGTMLIRDSITPANDYNGLIAGKLTITGSLPATPTTGPISNSTNYAEYTGAFPLPVYGTGYTLFAYGESPSGSGAYFCLNDSNGLYSNGSYIQNNGSALAYRCYNNGLGYLVGSGAYTNNTPMMMALTVNNNGDPGGVATDGVYVDSGLSVAGYPTGLDRLHFGRIGAAGGTYLPNGRIRSVAYIPRVLSQAEMESLTTDGFMV